MTPPAETDPRGEHHPECNPGCNEAGHLLIGGPETPAGGHAPALDVVSESGLEREAGTAPPAGSTPGGASVTRNWWRRKPKHRHTWAYSPRTVVGWGIVRCSKCGKEDLYS